MFKRISFDLIRIVRGQKLVVLIERSQFQVNFCIGVGVLAAKRRFFVVFSGLLGPDESVTSRVFVQAIRGRCGLQLLQGTLCRTLGLDFRKNWLVIRRSSVYAPLSTRQSGFRGMSGLKQRLRSYDRRLIRGWLTGDAQIWQSWCGPWA